MGGKFDATALIERLELFEERLGITLEALSARVSEFEPTMVFLTVLGELHSKNGTALENDVRLQMAAYDTNGRMILQKDRYYSVEDFFGFEVFEFETNFDGTQVQIAKIRIFPQKG